MALKSRNTGKYDMLTNKNSNYFSITSKLFRWIFSIRVVHSIVSEDDHGFFELQRENWSYFIEKVLELSGGKNLPQ